MDKLGSGENCKVVVSDNGSTGPTGAEGVPRSAAGFRPGYMDRLFNFFGGGGGVGVASTLAGVTWGNILERIRISTDSGKGSKAIRFRKDSTVKGHLGYKLPLTDDVPRKHRLNTMRRVERRNFLRSSGLINRWKYLPRYLRTKNVATQRVAIDSLFIGGAS